MNPGVLLVPAVNEVAAAAELAVAAGAAEKPDTHALTDRPALDTRTKRVDPADDLVPGHSRRDQARKLSFDGCRVRMTYPACFNPQAHLARSRLRQRASDEIQHTRTRDFNGSKGCAHLQSPQRVLPRALQHRRGSRWRRSRPAGGRPP